jgi:Uri superfamily endonuclease
MSKPIAKGVYALILRLDRDRHIQIGRLGRFRFSAGAYVYVGSAWGPGGLAARISRHLRADKTCRWHIDYLCLHATITQVWAGRCRPEQEHLWARVFGGFINTAVPAKKFGSSDCRCPAHLFRLPKAPAIESFNRALHQRRSGKQQAQIWNIREESFEHGKPRIPSKQPFGRSSR